MRIPSGPRRRPELARAVAQYARRAAYYDLELAPFEPVRTEAIALLDPPPGATVLDVGCGTGLSFAPLKRRIGAEGRIVGVDPSPDMLAQARARIARRHWSGITLLQADAASDRWQLLVTAPAACAADCQQLVYLARQINIGLNRDANRAEHALAAAQALPAEFQGQLEQDYPRLKRYGLQPASGDQAPALWIVDPHGNLVLRYAAGANGKQILGDLQLLLKLSHIG